MTSSATGQPTTTEPGPAQVAVAALLALATAALFLWQRGHGLLADDALLAGLFTDPQVPVALAWDRILADLWTPWLFSDWPIYRPTATLLLAGWLSLVGLDPQWLGGLGGMLHAASIGLLWLLLVRLGRRGLGTLLAVLFAALHPATVEPQNWCSALPELLQLGATLIAAHAMLSARRGGGALAWCTWTLALYVALGAKESALAAIPALVVLDRVALRDSWLRLLRAHATPVGIALALYLPLRLVAVAWDPTAHGGIDTSAAALLGSLWSKFGLVLVPPLADHGPLASATAVVALFAACMWQGRSAGAVIAAAAVVAAYLSTASFHFVAPTYTGGRVLYSAVFAAAALLAAMVPLPNRWPRLRVAFVLLLATLVATSASRMSDRFAAFRDAGRQGEQLAAALRTAHAATPPDTVLCPVLFPDTVDDVLVFLPNLLFPLVDRPGATNRLLPLTFLNQIAYPSRHEIGRGLWLRQACELSAVLLAQPPLPAPPTMVPTTALRAAPPTPALELDCDAAGSVRFPGPLPPTWLEALELETAPDPGAALLVRWHFPGGAAPSDWRRLPLTAPGAAPRRAVLLDDLALIAAGLQLGGVSGAELGWPAPGERSPRPLAAGTRVRFATTAERLPAPTLPSDTTWHLDELDGRITAPATDGRMPLHCALLLPSSGQSFAVPPGRPLVLPDEVRRYLAWTTTLAPEIAVALWFHEQDGDGDLRRIGRRSTPIRFVLRR